MGYCMYTLNIISQLTYIPVLLLHQGTTVAACSVGYMGCSQTHSNRKFCKQSSYLICIIVLPIFVWVSNFGQWAV